MSHCWRIYLYQRTHVLHFRLALAPPFPGLRHFKQGRDFKQWTGDDSKGLMKVCLPLYTAGFSQPHPPSHNQIYLPAIAGIVPEEVVRAMAAFLEFCYLAHRAYLTDTTLRRMEDARQQFHQYRTIFQTSGVRPDGFSLPRQHSLDHYPQHIRNFGAPNGLCTSITEAKHIKAVKEPWRRSNHYEALGQMLLTNQRNEKLAAARADFTARGMLVGTCLSAALDAIQQSEVDANNDSLGAEPNAVGGAETEDDPYEDPDDDDDGDDIDNDNNGHPEPEDGNHEHSGSRTDTINAMQRPEATHGTDADHPDGHSGALAPREREIAEDGVVSGPRVSGFVVLARKPREYSAASSFRNFPLNVLVVFHRTALSTLGWRTRGLCQRAIAALPRLTFHLPATSSRFRCSRRLQPSPSLHLTDPCISFSCCDVLCPKRSLWYWRHAPGAHSCHAVMAQRPASLRLCLCRSRSLAAWLPKPPRRACALVHLISPLRSFDKSRYTTRYVLRSS